MIFWGKTRIAPTLIRDHLRQIRVLFVAFPALRPPKPAILDPAADET